MTKPWRDCERPEGMYRAALLWLFALALVGCSEGLPGTTPVAPLDKGRVTSAFGAREHHPILGHTPGGLHHGYDVAAPEGTPIRAARPGRVTFSGSRGGYGNLVEIDHGDGKSTRYAHASRLLVKVGEPVSAGTIIGLVGSTGLSTGPHLHYEVRQNGVALDAQLAGYALTERRPARVLSVTNRTSVMATKAKSAPKPRRARESLKTAGVHKAKRGGTRRT